MPQKKYEFDINNVMHEFGEYEIARETIFDLIFETDFNLRNKVITVYFDENTSITTTFKELLINMIILKPFAEFGYDVSPDFWYDYTEQSIASYFDRVIEVFAEEDIKTLNITIASCVKELSELAVKTNLRVGTTISVYEYIQAMKKEPRLREILDTSFAEESEYAKIENTIMELIDEVKSIIEEVPGSFRELIRGGAVNLNQFKQVCANIGPKPDLFGKLIPETIDTNFFKGLRNVSDYYIMSETARKVLILQSKSVRKSGYLTRKLSLLSLDTILDPTEEDCGARHLLKVEIKNKNVLSRFKNRWYKMNESDNELQLMSKYDEHLIGETVFVRSPITCANEKICKTCYGELATFNKELHVGILAILYLTSQLTQRLLSAKHLLQTKSPTIKWGKEFRKYFSPVLSQIFVQDTAKGYLIINEMDINECEFSGGNYINKFKIVNGDSEEEFEYEHDLFFTSQLIEAIEDTENREGVGYKISLKSFQEEPFFNIQLDNEEITTSLKKISSLIELKEHLGITDLHEFAQTMIDLMDENGIRLDAVHSEVILRNLFRDPENLCERPDFTKKELPDYTILRVVDAILKGKSVTVSLSFENLRQQLQSIDTFEKTGSSMLDEFYR
jgi:hypothetical protein